MTHTPFADLLSSNTAIVGTVVSPVGLILNI